MNNGFLFDRLSRDALIASFAFSSLGVLLWPRTAGLLLCALSVLLIALILFRAFATNVNRRHAELRGYESIVFSLKTFLSGAFAKVFKRNGSTASGPKTVKDDAYKYFKCPKCKKEYRAPKGRGRIRVTCKECGEQFEKKV